MIDALEVEKNCCVGYGFEAAPVVYPGEMSNARVGDDFHAVPKV